MYHIVANKRIHHTGKAEWKDMAPFGTQRPLEAKLKQFK